MKTLIIVVALLILSIGTARADGVIKDYEGADKWQHAAIGFATSGACNTVFNAPVKCFLASEAFGIAEQLYAIKTNPSKRKREGFYDLVGHTIGTYAGIVTTNGVRVYLTPGRKSMTLNIFASF